MPCDHRPDPANRRTDSTSSNGARTCRAHATGPEAIRQREFAEPPGKCVDLDDGFHIRFPSRCDDSEGHRMSSVTDSSREYGKPSDTQRQKTKT